MADAHIHTHTHTQISVIPAKKKKNWQKQTCRVRHWIKKELLKMHTHTHACILIHTQTIHAGQCMKKRTVLCVQEGVCVCVGQRMKGRKRKKKKKKNKVYYGKEKEKIFVITIIDT